jgi:hypothetical protein
LVTRPGATIQPMLFWTCVWSADKQKN